MKELWKDIPDFVGMYQVSNHGRVKSLARIVVSKKGQQFIINEKILKPINRGKNYMVVHLCRNSAVRKTSVHRLVAQAFLPNPMNHPFINHKDENPSNNHVNNLEWCSPQYNNTYGNANAKRSITMTNSPLISKAVSQFDLNGRFIAEYPSATTAKRLFGFAHISDVCLGKRSQCGGYVWKYNDSISTIERG